MWLPFSGPLKRLQYGFIAEVGAMGSTLNPIHPDSRALNNNAQELSARDAKCRVLGLWICSCRPIPLGRFANRAKALQR